MAPRYLLDTDICIYIRDRRPPKVLERFRALARGDAGISVITYGELTYGVMKSAQASLAKAAHEAIMQTLSILALPPAAGRKYGEIRAVLAAAGEIIGGNDLWIAAHALAENLILVTNNEREFKRIKGLKIENWARSSTP